MENKNEKAFAAANDVLFQKGLNKREYFSGLAMLGLVNKPITLCSKGDYEMAAKDSVKMADALLKALEDNSNG